LKYLRPRPDSNLRFDKFGTVIALQKNPEYLFYRIGVEGNKMRISEKIFKLLTKEEICVFIDKIWELLTVEQRNELSKSLNDDIPEIIDSISKEKNKTFPSNQKTIEEWNELLKKLNDIIYEAGNENGKYIEKEPHWEPPYCDRTYIAKDIEKISGQILNFIKNSFDTLPKNENLFFDLFKELGRQIDLLPEWFYSMEDRMRLEKKSTECVLLWEYSNIKKYNLTIKDFINRLVDYDIKLNIISFDKDVFINFILELSEKESGEILEAIRNHPYLIENRNKTYYMWTDLYKKLSEKYDESSYIIFCKNTIQSDWKNGVPVIEKLIEEKKYAEAEKIIENTLSVFLNDKKWKKFNILIFPLKKTFYNYQEKNKNLLMIFNFYKIILEKTERHNLLNVVDFQINVMNKVYLFELIKNEYKKNFEDKIFIDLYSQWKEYIVSQTLDYHYKNKKKNWVHYLIETEIEKKNDYKNGITNICDWANRLTDYQVFIKEKNILRILTRDLNTINKISENFPFFYKNIIIENYYSNSEDELEIERKKYLNKFDTNAIYDTIMNIWILHAKKLVPDPNITKNSNYWEHIQCLKSVMEISPETGKRILERWKSIYKNRKNLWKEYYKVFVSIR